MDKTVEQAEMEQFKPSFSPYNYQNLKEPIRGNEIEWRVQSAKEVTKGEWRLVVVAYITNRCVMERFDNAFGWDCWNNEFRETSTGYICRITLSNGVYKEDGATKTNIEPDKGGISDAMKRCAVQFGLGRDLYNYPTIYVKSTNKYIPKSAMGRLIKMADHFAVNGIDKEIINI